MDNQIKGELKMKIEVVLNENVDIAEFRKVLCFVSEEILSYDVMDDTLMIQLKDEADAKGIENRINEISGKYKKQSDSFWKEQMNDAREKFTYRENVLEDENLFFNFGDGMLSLRGKALFLYYYFEESFSKVAKNIGAVAKQYPVLIPVVEYIKTGYLKRTPQYAMFCCNAHENLYELENLEQSIHEKQTLSKLSNPSLALSPSACFHTYVEYKDKTLEKNSVYSFTQSVFRNEGRLNYDELGRLRDYHVREIVFFGNDEYVKKTRQEIVNLTIKLLEQWEIKGVIQTASDPFVLPKMQKYRKIQLLDDSKYEMRLNISDEKDIAVASFNLHGTAFTDPFNIHIKDCEEAVTGCVGYGIERWVLAFLCQYGGDDDKWPDCIKQSYQNYDREG